jgi:hypothetical protein
MNESDELIDSEGAAHVDMPEEAMLIKLKLPCVAGDPIGVGAHATVEVDSIAFEGTVGLHTQLIGEVPDEFAGAIDNGELSGLEASEKPIDSVDARVKDELGSYDGFRYQFVRMMWYERVGRCMYRHGLCVPPE